MTGRLGILQDRAWGAKLNSALAIMGLPNSGPLSELALMLYRPKHLGLATVLLAVPNSEFLVPILPLNVEYPDRERTVLREDRSYLDVISSGCIGGGGGIGKSERHNGDASIVLPMDSSVEGGVRFSSEYSQSLIVI